MKFGINDFQFVKMNSKKNYYVERKAYYKTMEEAIEDARRIYERMTYYFKKDNRYKKIFVLIGVSNTKGKTANKIKKKTKGRPKYEIIGKRCKPHIHICCFGINAPSYIKFITDLLNKGIYKTKEDFFKRGYKAKRLFWIKKLKGEDYGLAFIPYVYKQSSKIFTIGKENLDFDKIKWGQYILQKDF